MDPKEYFLSLTQELEALKGRVRTLIQGQHWQTDGEWKESVLRVILNRHLPQTIEAARGFVITAEGNTGQIDVLLYDRTKPVLFRDGDLVFVTSDAVVGIIEVKSSIDGSTRLREVVAKLGKEAQRIRDSGGAHENLFVGLFSYNLRGLANGAIMESIHRACPEMRSIVNHLCLGPDLFAKFWEHHPTTDSPYNSWRLYDLEKMAAGYFVNNLMLHLSGQSVAGNRFAYFPSQSKELSMVAEIQLLPSGPETPVS